MKKIFLFIITMVVARATLMAQVPDFTMTDCNGVTHHLYDDLAAGNAVVLNVCAGWCGPCRLADPLLQDFYEHNCSGNGNVKVYGMLYQNNTVGQNSDCTFGTQYANQYGLTFPIFTNCGAIAEQYINLYDPSQSIPLFVMIIPNTADPANSTVSSIEGYDPNLETLIAEKLNLGVNAYIPVITVSGNTCSGPVTLTSNFATGNHWSTGETAQSITITATGTYTLTLNNGGCDKIVSKTFELNPGSLVGTAGISTTSVCAGGTYTLSYAVPAGYTGSSTWQYARPDNPGFWQDYVPADLGDFLDNTVGYPVGDQVMFRVKVQTGSNEACALYSDTVYLTITNAQPAAAGGIAGSSKETACVGSAFTLTYTGNEQGAIWEYYSNIYNDWVPQYNASQGPVTLDATTNGNTTVNSISGDRFRVIVPNGNCFAVSNEVAIAYVNPTPVISGPNQVCSNSGNINLSVSDAGPDVYANTLWSPGGQTTSSISVDPSVNNQFTVTITDIYGCSTSASKTVSVLPASVPVISSSASGPVCQGSPVTLSFKGTNTIPACTNDVYGQWPVDAFSFSNCDQAIEQIVSDGYAGEYSAVNVEAGKLYIFFSLNNDGSMTYTGDNITITDANGTSVLSTGVNYTYFVSDFTGQVRFYTHESGCVSNNETFRQRWAFCSGNPDAYGGYAWSPGGATKHSITVNPTVSTSYTLTFSNLDFFTGTGCGSGTVSTEVEVIPLSDWILDNDTDGYYPGNPFTACVSPGSGYIIKTTQLPGDCDDNNAALNPATLWYEDRDNDGYSNLYTVSGCERPKIYYGGAFSFTFTYGKLASELTSLTQDCDDTRANINPGIVWYKDADNDGFSDGATQSACYRPSGYKLPTEVNTGGDCDDGNAAINPNTRWYPDLDNDGYSIGNYIVQCQRPANGKLPNELIATSGDCNDNNGAINPNTTWFKDADNDGYSDGTLLRQCARPVNYKLPSELTATFGDCNDNDAAIHSPVQYYIDADHDGYGSNATALLCSLTAPVGYSTNNTDCNDNSAALTPLTIWYKDADNDGYSDGTIATQCTQPTGYKLATALTATSGDCNDGNAAVNPATVWYEDRDGDGYSSLVARTQCEQPKFYYGGVLSTTYTLGKLASQLNSLTLDCDDTRASVNPGVAWYKDADNDGYSDGTRLFACTRPTGYKLVTEVNISGDCNDADYRLNPNTFWYRDNDNDGYSNGATLRQCAQPTGYKLAAALAATSGDCNDDNAAINPNTIWLKDADNDGYSDGTSRRQCTQPAGFKLPSSLLLTYGDCNDNNASLNPATVWIVDRDEDGYYTGSPVTRCTSPGNNYIIKTTQLPGDCSDNNASVNPGAVEVCGNGIDDNCNGIIDEATCYPCQNAANLQTTSITSSAAQLNWTATANPVQWQLHYKKDKQGANWQDVFVSGNKRSVVINSLSSGQNYTWQIRAKCGNNWTVYSAPASFRTTGGSTLSRPVPATPETVEINTGNISVYPNPTNGMFTIALRLNSSAATAIIILTDATGSTIYKQKANMVNGKLNQRIQMPANAASGVYILQVNADGESYQSRLVYIK